MRRDREPHQLRGHGVCPSPSPTSLGLSVERPLMPDRRRSHAIVHGPFIYPVNDFPAVPQASGPLPPSRLASCGVVAAVSCVFCACHSGVTPGGRPGRTCPPRPHPGPLPTGKHTSAGRRVSPDACRRVRRRGSPPRPLTSDAHKRGHSPLRLPARTLAEASPRRPAFERTAEGPRGPRAAVPAAGHLRAHNWAPRLFSVPHALHLASGGVLPS